MTAAPVLFPARHLGDAELTANRDAGKIGENAEKEREPDMIASPTMDCASFGVQSNILPTHCREDSILPPGGATECSDEWYPVGRGAYSPNILHHVGLYRAGG